MLQNLKEFIKRLKNFSISIFLGLLSKFNIFGSNFKDLYLISEDFNLKKPDLNPGLSLVLFIGFIFVLLSIVFSDQQWKDFAIFCRIMSLLLLLFCTVKFWYFEYIHFYSSIMKDPKYSSKHFNYRRIVFLNFLLIPFLKVCILLFCIGFTAYSINM
jgi:hypothetical protein